MSYQSQREKIIAFFEDKIFSALKLNIDKELDYYKTIGIIVSEIGVSESMVEDQIKSLIQSGKIVEERRLVLSLSEKEKIKQQRTDEINLDFKNSGI